VGVLAYELILPAVKQKPQVPHKAVKKIIK
jgi:hypothetical protein